MKRTAFNDNWSFYMRGEKAATVRLPHDAMIHRDRDPKAASGPSQGFFPGGYYVYENYFTCTSEQKHVVFQFEGVYKNAKVFINEHLAGGIPYGYLPFFVVADDFLKDGINIIRVECDNEQQPDSRWYSGSGIYRPVWMWTSGTEYIQPEGVKVRTLSVAPAQIQVRTEHTGSNVRVEIFYGQKLVAESYGDNVLLDIPEAKLWDEDTPNLYTYRVSLDSGDIAQGTFGIRQMKWDTSGLYINGKQTLLRGGCVHHGSGILGAATYDESEFRRVRMLKEAGFNAIRSAHNPCSRAMLEACDTLGVYVVDESWDMWYQSKNPYDYAGFWREHYKNDLTAMVDRDYNHPSVIMYSVGNEVSEPGKPEGVDYLKEMVSHLHTIDSTRAVTGGFNLMIIHSASRAKDEESRQQQEKTADEQRSGGLYTMNSTLFNMVTGILGSSMNQGANSKSADEATSPALDVLDIAGYNYASGRYPLEENSHPDRVIYGSETMPYDISKNWAMVKKYPYLIGDFMWTAWDYLGETGLGAWAYTSDARGWNKPYPWLLADAGAMDILGNPNAELYWAQAAWGLLEKPAICVRPVNHPGVTPIKGTWRGTNGIPSWSWQGCKGNKAIVEVFSDAVAIEMYLNGKSLGKKKVKENRVIFKTKYIPGELKAVAYDISGKPISENRLVSAIGKSSIHVRKENTGEIIYLDISILGENGIVESNADVELTITVEDGELLAFGSANPRTEGKYDIGRFSTYFGKAQAVVRKDMNTMVMIAGKNDSVTIKL